MSAVNRRHGVNADHKPQSGPAGLIVIGRDKSCDFRLCYPCVSRRHASLMPQAGGVFLLRDLESRNGTFAGSPAKRVKAVTVTAGEAIRLGDQSVRVADIIAGAYRPAPDPASAEGFSTRKAQWAVLGLALALILYVGVSVLPEDRQAPIPQPGALRQIPD